MQQAHQGANLCADSGRICLNLGQAYAIFRRRSGKSRRCEQARRAEYRRKTMAKTGQGGLEAITAALPRENKGPPPVHRWNPPFCGDIDMRIAADGTWFYQKTPIGRPALVKLFASVLKREGDKYFLVTPVEKVGIIVDDAPFLAVEMKTRAGGSGADSCNFAPMSTTGSRPGRSTRCASSRRPNRRPQALSARAPRPVGQGDARAVLRSGRARRGARGRRQGDVRRRLRRRVLRHGGSERVREFA